VIKILKMSEDPGIQKEVVKRLPDHPGLTEKDLSVRFLVEALQSRIQFASVGPGIYRIMVVDHSPESAQLLAKWISELFVDVMIQKELEQIRMAREFGAEQLRVYEEQLDRSEEALEQYRGTLIGQSLSGNVVNVKNLPTAENLFRRLTDEAATAKARVPPLARAAKGTGLAPADSRLTQHQDVRNQARRISSSLDRAVAEKLAMPPAELGVWPPAGILDVRRRDLHRELEAIAVQLYPNAEDSELSAIVDHAFASVDAEIQTQVSENLRQSIDSFKRRAQMQPVDEIELARLEEEVAKNQQLLQSFRAQMVASDVSQAVETTNLGLRIEIIDPAQVPLKPSRPNRMKILVSAILVGPLIGIGFAFLSELLDPTLRTLEDIKRVAPEPVFGTIPLIDNLPQKRKGIRRHWIPAALAGIALLTAVFFVARTTILSDFEMVKPPFHTIDPGTGASP
jgi:capsular polysaccharide biosynthesis protein